MGSSLGRQRAEQRENQQSAGDCRPRAKSTVLPASAPYSVLPPSQLCQALLGKGPQGDGPPAVPPTPRRDAVWAGCRAGPGRRGCVFVCVFSPYVEHAVRRCLWADLGNGWLLYHCRLVQAYASGQLLWGFLLLSAFRAWCFLLGKQMHGDDASEVWCRLYVALKARGFPVICSDA